MADITFDCPHCQNHIVVDACGAGVEVPCPHCSHSLVIPTANPLSGKSPDSERPPERRFVMKDIRTVILDELNPGNASFADRGKLLALGVGAVPILIQCFLEPRTQSGALMNQAVIADALIEFSKMPNPMAEFFIKRILNDEVPLDGTNGNAAKLIVQQHFEFLQSQAVIASPDIAASLDESGPEWWTIDKWTNGMVLLFMADMRPIGFRLNFDKTAIKPTKHQLREFCLLVAARCSYTPVTGDKFCDLLVSRGILRSQSEIESWNRRISCVGGDTIDSIDTLEIILKAGKWDPTMTDRLRKGNDSNNK